MNPLDTVTLLVMPLSSVVECTNNCCTQCGKSNDTVKVRWKSTGETRKFCGPCWSLDQMPKWKRDICRSYLNQPYENMLDRGNGAW